MKHLKNPAPPVEVDAIQLTHPLTVGEHQYNPGDYVVVGTDGVSHMKKDEFESNYSPAKKRQARAPRSDIGKTREKKDAPAVMGEQKKRKSA
jgi:regulator of RNase E activity RraA